MEAGRFWFSGFCLLDTLTLFFATLGKLRHLTGPGPSPQKGMPNTYVRALIQIINTVRATYAF